LTPEQAEWKATPVLEYLEPFALYHPEKDGEYIELQHLGTRCRLFFAQSDDINQRANGTYSEEFVCPGYAQAFARKFLFTTDTGIEFADDHSVRALSAAEVQETQTLIAERQYCLLSLEFVDNPWLDPNEDLPPLDRFTCLSPAEYYALQNELSQP
jgi:hypothetical protein